MGDESATAEGVDPEVALAQARLRWKQCKQSLALIQGIAPPDMVQLFKKQALEAKAALDRIKPPGERP